MHAPTEVPLGTLTAALGMSTARWMAMPVEVVEVASLTPVQAVEVDLWPAGRANAHTSGDPCIHVVEILGVRLVEDGHHRLARAKRRGYTEIAARVLRLSIRGMERAA